MAVQQSKVSKQSVRARRSANSFKGVENSSCPKCGAARLPHRVCKACGHYNDRQVVSVTAE